jgi:nicotinamide mononucleotide transporter
MVVMNWLTANWIEVFGVLTGAICVWYLAKNKAVLGWSFGIVNAAFFVVLFFQNRIYAETALNGYYLVTCIWGLYLWKFRKRNDEDKAGVPITRINRNQMTWVAIWLAGGTAVGTWLLGFTDTDVAFLDAITTTASLIAQYLLAKKVFENWYIWIAADVLYVGLFFYKGLYLTSGLYVVFMAICVKGLIEWKKVEAQERNAVLSDLPDEINPSDIQVPLASAGEVTNV